ncbi:hypothetical protein LX64_00536 [Chitinophaga skermanii]|uniref:Tetratricopeptide repeat protein n=1 Tax=Chitinophaga skermanii TaxID=331697 RepID=A0A327R255_9BACT|nr:hypothetical protein [Chitinophaga skermanii]RAJ10929.1 hypothetical protein LX64_00536 [Chitinophaga skermanii]
MRYLTLLFPMMLLFACSETGKKQQKVDDTPKLNASNLYNREAVFALLKDGKLKNDSSQKLFLRAIDLFRNQQQPQQAIGFFKQSIFIAPQAQSYYELGNALLSVKGDNEMVRTTNMKEAVNAFKMALALDYKPVNKLLYNISCAYSLLGNRELAEHYLTSAIEFGYGNFDQIMKDPDMQYLRENGNLKYVLQEAFAGVGDPAALQWTLFYRSFSPIELPLVLNEKSGPLYEENSLYYDYEVFIPEMSRDDKFSRETGSVYYAVGTLKTTPIYRSLIYAVKDVMYTNMLPPMFVICNYNAKTGRIIDKMVIAGRDKLEDPFVVGDLLQDGKFQLTFIDLKFSKKREEMNYEDELKEVSRKELYKEMYTINEEGKFVKETPSLASR